MTEPTTERLADLGLVDCGEAMHKERGKKVRVVWLKGQYYCWDQDALDRKYGLGKYLFQPRFSLKGDTPNGQ